MSFLINHQKNRTREYAVDLFEADGTTAIVLQADDVVRVKIGRGENTPDLDMDSSEPEPGGSTVTFAPATNDVIVRIHQADTVDLVPGVAYDCEVAVFDADEDVLKHAETGVLFLHPSQAGDVSEEQSSSSSSSGSSSS
jgi:hypothetical protein